MKTVVIPPFLVSARAAFQIKFRASAHVLKMSRDPYKNWMGFSYFSLFDMWKLIVRKYRISFVFRTLDESFTLLQFAKNENF